MVAIWNIKNGRNAVLESACRALLVLGVNLALLKETKLTDGIYARIAFGYHVVALDTPSKQQGGDFSCMEG